MVTSVQSPVQNSQPPQGPPTPDVAALAQRTLDANRAPNGTLDVAGVKRDLDQIAAQDPAVGGWVQAQVERQLTPVQRGELASASYAIGDPQGEVRFQAGAPTVADYRAMPAGSEGRATYDALDRRFGDGNPATDDTAAINAGLTDMIATGGTVPAGGAPPTPANDTGPSAAVMVADLGQMALDIVGIFEPTPFADGTNTVVSLGRALFEWDASHLVNAGASAAGIFPYLGDTAKIAKIPQWARTVANAVETVAANPAARQALEPALREIADAIDKIPAGALDMLPAGACEAFDGMKRQLDEFFGVGVRNADNVPRFGDANVGRSVRINGQDVTIGAAPATARRADGVPTAQTANGNDVALRQPATYDARTVNPDGTVTYTRGGSSVQYDANGFPMFNSRADVFLPPDKLAVGSRSTHFTESNRILARESDDTLRGAGFNNAEIAQLRRGETPDNMTWHHHQDTGRMQLVRTTEHETFRGGHTGGWSLWGDSSRFKVQ